MREKVIDINELLGENGVVSNSLVEFDLLIWSLSHTPGEAQTEPRINEILIDTCLFWTNYHYGDLIPNQELLTEFIINIVNAVPELKIQQIEDEIQMFLFTMTLNRLMEDEIEVV